MNQPGFENADGPLSPAVDLQRNKNIFSPQSVINEHFDNLCIHSPEQVQSPGENDCDKLKVFQKPSHISQQFPHIPENKPVNAAELVNRHVPSVEKQTIKKEPCEEKFKTKVTYDEDDFISLKEAPKPTECKLGSAGKIECGSTFEHVKIFTQASFGYEQGIQIACNAGIPLTEDLVVNVRGKTPTDVAIGSDCVKGIYLGKQVYD